MLIPMRRPEGLWPFADTDVGAAARTMAGCGEATVAAGATRIVCTPQMGQATCSPRYSFGNSMFVPQTAQGHLCVSAISRVRWEAVFVHSFHGIGVGTTTGDGSATCE